MKKIYLAQLGNNVVWNGMCKHYVHEGRNILSFRFTRDNEGILEILAEQKEACEKVDGDYECCMSIRQFGTEKCDSDIEKEWKEEIEIYEINNALHSFVHIEGIWFRMLIDTAEDFSDFAFDKHPNDR